MIRVLVVDDSPTVRHLLVNYLESEPDIKVVATAKDGLEAVKIVPEIKPDIIVMDINMPNMNGFEATKKIMESHPTPILLISADWNMDDVRIALKSMGIGALGALEKPKGPGHDNAQETIDDLIDHIKILSQIKVIRRSKETDTEMSDKKPVPLHVENKIYKTVLIGASTGGPPVINDILKDLPADYPLPILIVQHMTHGFTENFIHWLNANCLLHVKQAVDGEMMQHGYVYFSVDGQHITINHGRIRFTPPQVGELFVPSVSKLFASAVGYDARQTIAIILTGMGRDGAAEMKMLRDSGALTIAQDEKSSIVFGMPKEAINLGAVELILSPAQIKDTLLKLIEPKDKS